MTKNINYILLLNDKNLKEKIKDAFFEDLKEDFDLILLYDKIRSKEVSDNHHVRLIAVTKNNITLFKNKDYSNRKSLYYEDRAYYITFEGIDTDGACIGDERDADIAYELNFGPFICDKDHNIRELYSLKILSCNDYFMGYYCSGVQCILEEFDRQGNGKSDATDIPLEKITGYDNKFITSPYHLSFTPLPDIIYGKDKNKVRTRITEYFVTQYGRRDQYPFGEIEKAL
jgi:hypothetical protein